MRLEHKVAIVTGAARGIGYAIAQKFLEEGASVVLADVDDRAGPRAADELSEFGEVRYVECDVGEPLDVRNLVAATVDGLGAVDVLVNNAGVATPRPFLELDEQTFDEVLKTNLKGAFLCAQKVARQMVERIEGGDAPGTIVNVVGLNAMLAVSGNAAYAASQGAIAQLTRSMSVELAPHGIRVNAVAPGYVHSELGQGLMDLAGGRDAVVTRTPMKRVGEVDDIADIVAFLASDEARFMTGQVLVADGGRLVNEGEG